MVLVGEPQIATLFNRVSKVIATDSWDESLEKILKVISRQINQATARFKIAQRIREAQPKEEVRRLGKKIELKRTGANSTAGRGSARVSCSTCTRPTHSKAVCPNFSYFQASQQ